MSRNTDMHGFTLIELMITMALLAIIALIAIPNFSALIERNRLEVQAEELKAFLLYARGEAVTRRVAVTVTVEDELPWRLQSSDMDEQIRELEHAPEVAKIYASADKITFRSNGTATATTFAVCHDEDPTTGYFLEVRASGATNLYRRGKKDADGTALSRCAQ